MLTRSIGAALTVAVGLALPLASPLTALALVVTRYDDPAPDGCLPGDCSLREAVRAAEATSVFDEIRLSAGIYELTRVDVSGDEDESLTGDLDLNTPARVVGPAATMTVIDAKGTGALFEIQPDGTLSLTGLTLRGGEGTVGAAVFVAGILSMDRCELRDNAMVASSPVVQVSLSGNVAIRRSTIAGNGGEGIRVTQSGAFLENVTISENESSELVIDDSEASCIHCTIADTSNPDLAGVLVLGDALLHLANSILATHCSTNTGGFIDSLGGNLESTGSTCGLDEGDDHDGIFAFQLMLGQLGDNGGPTATRQPGPSSLALNLARDVHCQLDDQRGAARPGTACDRGAVERTSTKPPTPLFLDGFEAGNSGAWVDAVP